MHLIQHSNYLLAVVIARLLRKSLRPGAGTPYICRYFRRRSDDSGGTSPYSVFHSPMIVVKFRLFALTFRRPCCSSSASPAPGNAATTRGAAVERCPDPLTDAPWASFSDRSFLDRCWSEPNFLSRAGPEVLVAESVTAVRIRVG